ncbi:uncharacterized protein EV422DRAFT_513105 [Fimicolochytrium jonesii]|uniref:uncharacterized protein n=1 Tax=Fimicolochytrium jonesii TaxID=1396493 RepID=UPI0022FDDC23|nr:uncharacterized protein EV422DRAFT_513105 [Fimicolochytrium jonesii]KAI8827227.1 hypothetical protein EV422DRAFT_513105 [Fimicolochytrium jonesii]
MQHPNSPRTSTDDKDSLKSVRPAVHADGLNVRSRSRKGKRPQLKMPSVSTSHLRSLPLITFLTLLLLLTLLRPFVSANKPKFGVDGNYLDYAAAAQYGRSHLHDSPPTSASTPPFTDTSPDHSLPSEYEDLLYFFSLSDRNGDHHLDGHELRQTYTTAGGTAELPPKEYRLPLEEVESMIDHTLLEDDTDGDGRISWGEYLASQVYHQKI